MGPAPQEAFANEHRCDLAGAAHGHILSHPVNAVEQNHTYVAFLEVHGNAFNAILELDELVGAHIFESVDVGNTVADLKDCSNFFERHL